MTPDEPIPTTAELWTLIQEQRTEIQALKAERRDAPSPRPSRGRSSVLLTSLLLVVLLVAAPALTRTALADSSDITTADSTQQYTLVGSDGSTWVTMDATNLSFSLTPVVDSTVVLSGNADLWTSSAGYNQDLGIAVSGGSYSGIVAWKESGGFAGTFSPNAALVHTVIALSAGITYTVRLQWKANKADPGTIWAGAGAGSPFSPTRLTAQLRPGSGYVYSSTTPQQGAILQYQGSSWVPLLSFCPSCNKDSADLSGLDLSGASFPNIRLHSANLTFTDLAYSNLIHAYLVSANLTNGSLVSANLTLADLNSANLTSANLNGATGGTTATVTGVTWSTTQCPDNTNSDSDGFTCVGHGF